MTDPAPDRSTNFLDRRFDSKGLKPRVAASVIATLWLIAIIVSGALMRLLDPGTFATVWDGLWWATQTVTTVGYGDIVPASAAGQFVAAVLMVGGLSFFAVVTAWITTQFVTRAAGDRDGAGDAELAAVREELAAIRAKLEQLGGAPPPAD